MSEEIKQRTRAFALRVIRLVDNLPNEFSARHIGHQLLRPGTSVGANYRAACRARSPAEFRSKMGIVEEEADESIYWMELLIEGGLVRDDLLSDLMDEANQILAITVASIRTSKRNKGS
jgi:four helix bundle protein